jgi:hypothetical protein
MQLRTKFCNWLIAIVLIDLMHARVPCDACGGCGVGQFCPAGVTNAITCPPGTLTTSNSTSIVEDFKREDPLHRRHASGLLSVSCVYVCVGAEARVRRSSSHILVLTGELELG